MRVSPALLDLEHDGDYSTSSHRRNYVILTDENLNTMPTRCKIYMPISCITSLSSNLGVISKPSSIRTVI